MNFKCKIIERNRTPSNRREMSNKSKKVQFNEKRRVRKYERDDEEDDGSENGGDATDELGVTKKIKHSLDSDEEDDNTEKYEILNRSALNGKY